MAEGPPFTNLQLVQRVDTWPYYAQAPDAYRRHMEDYHYFMIKGYEKLFGYVHNHFIHQMEWPEYWEIDAEKRFLSFDGGDSFEDRSQRMNETLRKNHESKKVPALVHWASEEFPLISAAGEHVLDLDGCGVDMFVIVNFTVHMIGWVATTDGMKIWVPRRAMTKKCFPGMLDNTVGGGLATGERPIEAIVRESEEEICLSPEYTRSNIKACGTNSFHLTVTDLLEPACQHQVQYVYEIELREDIVPRIGDGEVGEPYLKSIPEVVEAMRNGEFKPACSMTYLSFLIRHGYVNAENELDFVEICSRLHRKHDLFVA